MCCAGVCVYLLNSASLCCSAWGLVRRGTHSDVSLFTCSWGSYTYTHTHTKRHTQCSLCADCGKKRNISWVCCDFSGGSGVSEHPHSRFCQVELQIGAALVGCFLQYPACSVVHLRLKGLFMWKHYLPFCQSFAWQRHQFQIVYRTNSRSRQRITANWFPRNFHSGNFFGEFISPWFCHSLGPSVSLFHPLLSVCGNETVVPDYQIFFQTVRKRCSLCTGHQQSQL